jgi:energy-converting hydrogenase Eha subunit A
MRKTLLIAAAAFAASVISSQAQVYSQNIVGYVNIPLTAGVLANVAPSLDLDGTGTNNTVSTVFPTPVLGDNVYVFNGSGYTTLNYKSLGTGHPVVYTTNWFLGVTASPNYPINPGESVFYLPAANETVTQVGTALTGTNVNAYFPAAGQVALLSSVIPISGGLTSVLGYKPNLGDNVYIYNGTGYTTYNYKSLGTGHPVVYTTNWFLGVTASEPVVNVGQGFLIDPAVANTWTEILNVQ